jgi:hypothetical protein
MDGIEGWLRLCVSCAVTVTCISEKHFLDRSSVSLVMASI